MRGMKEASGREERESEKGVTERAGNEWKG